MEPEARDVEANAQDWIDPAAARRLLIEYRQALGVKGGSEIERQIAKHTRLGISRKTIENWLNDANSVPSPQTLGIVLRFLRTKHFQKVVPRSQDYLEADARLCRIGAALFDLYGASDKDATALAESSACLAGWWVAPRCFDGNSSEPSYLYIVPVADQPFSKVHLLLRSDDVPTGPGVMFPSQGGSQGEFVMRVWSKEKHYREKALAALHILDVANVPEYLCITFEPREQPVPFPGVALVNVMFYRVEENEVPGVIRDTFDEWSSDPLPRDLTRRTLVS